MVDRMAVRGAVGKAGRSLALAAALVAGVSACGDSTAPWSEFQPERVVERLDGVLDPLAGDGDLLLNLDLVVAALVDYGSAGLAGALSLRSDGDQGMLRALRADRRRTRATLEGADASGSEGSPSAFSIPWDVEGETLEWDPSYGGYVISGRSGAPMNGVRVVLYQMDGGTGYPAEPLAVVGYLDLIEDDDAQAEAVRVRAVRTAGPDRVIADYRVSLTGSGTYDEGEMTIRTRGDIAQMGSVELDLLERLEWSRSRDRDRLTLDYTYRQGSRSVVLEGLALARYEALEWETFEFSTEFLGERPVVEVEALLGSSGSVTGEILSGGGRVVRIGGDDRNPTFERADGGQLSWSERADLERIWSGITDLIWWTDWAMIPADLLVMAG